MDPPISSTGAKLLCKHATGNVNFVRKEAWLSFRVAIAIIFTLEIATGVPQMGAELDQ